jgi:hypothetical protein
MTIHHFVPWNFYITFAAHVTALRSTKKRTTRNRTSR